MSKEDIALNLMRETSMSTGDESDCDGGNSEERSGHKRKKKHSVDGLKPRNAIYPLPDRMHSTSPLSPVSQNYDTLDALKEITDIVVDPAARHPGLEFDLILSLHQAAREGDVDTIKHYLSLPKTKHRLNVLDEERFSPLHYAARYSHFVVIELLLENGADVNIVGDEGLMPLHYAARYHKKRKPRILSSSTLKSNEKSLSFDNESGGVMKYLVNSGAKINGQDKYGMTPLHYAAMRGNEVAARDLLSFETVKIEAEDKQMTTPLHYASLYGYFEIVKILVESGASLRVMNNDKNTALHLAADEGKLDIVEYLISAADEAGGWPMVTQMIDDKDEEKNTPLHRAVENSHYDIVKLLVSKGANVNAHRKNFIFPLHQAATNGNLEILKLLIENNARIDCLNIHQSTPLHRAAAFNHFDIVEFLLHKGAKIEAKDRDGYTPLLWATCNGHADTVKMLLHKDADVTAVDKCEKTAVFIAAEENHIEVLNELLENADVQSIIDFSDKYDNSPLHAAAEDGYLNIIKVLLEKGADLTNKNEEGKHVLHIAAENGRTKLCLFLIGRSKVIIQDEDEDSNTALHLAALNGHYRVIKLLLSAGADIEAVNCNLWTALDCAAVNGNVKSVKVLLEGDSPIDPIDRNMTTPLHLAAKEGYANVVKTLLDNGADASRINAKGKNCLDLAIDRGKKEAVLAIVNHEKWMEALKNERKDSYGLRMTPMRELIKRMPDVAEVVFRRCISTNNLPSDHYNLEVTFNYEFLDDAFACYEDKDSDRISLNEIYDENNRILPTADLYSSNVTELKNNHPLMIMARAKRQALLGHPLCTSLIECKWKLFGRYVFYSNLLLYTLFLIMLTGYALYQTDPNSAESIKKEMTKKNPNTTWEDVYRKSERTFVHVGRMGILILAGFHILRELFQVTQKKWHYFNLENLMEWICYVTAFLFVLSFDEDFFLKKWQWEVGAIAVFLAWVDLVMIMKKFPFLGIYVVMFTDILKTFSRFFIIFFLFVLAFALGFHLLLHNKVEFQTMEQSLIKTSVMMIGEFEFDGIFSGPYVRRNLNYPGLSLALFSIFMIVMSIILMNLLVGLAVDDIKAVAEQAALQKLAMQADLVLSVEAYLPKFLRRHFTKRIKRIFPNRRYKFKIFTYLFQNSSEYLDSVANALTYKEEVKFDELKIQQEEIITSLSHLKENMRQLSRQNRRLESMLMTVVRNDNLSWDDEDEI